MNASKWQTPYELFLLYSPLNQGLKLIEAKTANAYASGFLLYSPLNQGLKHQRRIDQMSEYERFLLYSPLNQGLKPNSVNLLRIIQTVFTLQSIKSRIETTLCPICARRQKRFLLYSPLNQGLKLNYYQAFKFNSFGFYSTVH